MTGTDALTIDFCGEIYPVETDQVFTIGRDADLIVDDDNVFLHRKLAELRYEHGFWWVVNVGSRLALTISGEAGSLQSWVGPGSRMPLVLPEVALLFTAGETTYEVLLSHAGAGFEHAEVLPHTSGETTAGVVSLTYSQLLLILALAEPTLRRSGTGSSEVPPNSVAARRLGWPITTFNRKLDNVCDKYSRAGVKGLRGTPGQLATNRRARLVEYAVAARVVRSEHLPMLDQQGQVAS